jgi:hypothetical protein
MEDNTFNTNKKDNTFNYIMIFVGITLVIYLIYLYFSKSSSQSDSTKNQFAKRFKKSQSDNFTEGVFKNLSPEPTTTTESVCTGNYSDWNNCDKLCNGTQTRNWIPNTPTDTCVSKTESQSCNYCGNINDMNDINTYYSTDKRSFNNFKAGGNITDNKSLYECGKMCNDSESCGGFSYYNSKLTMPQSYWDNKGVCQTYSVDDYKNNKLNKDGQPSWPNLISGIKIKLIQ